MITDVSVRTRGLYRLEQRPLCHIPLDCTPYNNTFLLKKGVDTSALSPRVSWVPQSVSAQ